MKINQYRVANQSILFPINALSPPLAYAVPPGHLARIHLLLEGAVVAVGGPKIPAHPLSQVHHEAQELDLLPKEKRMNINCTLSASRAGPNVRLQLALMINLKKKCHN